MTEDTRSVFDAVADGPAPSDAPVGTDVVSTAQEPSDHPSIVALKENFGDAILRWECVSGDQHVVYVDPAKNLEILAWLKQDDAQHYEFLSDVTAVDFGGGRPLQVVYQLFSLAHHRTLRVKAELPLNDLRITSLCSLWKTANWLEREVWDLFGIEFIDHPDHRRILMPDDYAEGHPLRKDFPLRGRFSRAEQTRRALTQDLDHDYTDFELEGGRTPQTLPGQLEEQGEVAPPPTES